MPPLWWLPIDACPLQHREMMTSTGPPIHVDLNYFKHFYNNLCGCVLFPSRCWLDAKSGLIWAFIAPALLTLLVSDFNSFMWILSTSPLYWYSARGSNILNIWNVYVTMLLQNSWHNLLFSWFYQSNLLYPAENPSNSLFTQNIPTYIQRTQR